MTMPLQNVVQRRTSCCVRRTRRNSTSRGLSNRSPVPGRLMLRIDAARFCIGTKRSVSMARRWVRLTRRFGHAMSLIPIHLNVRRRTNASNDACCPSKRTRACVGLKAFARRKNSHSNRPTRTCPVRRRNALERSATHPQPRPGMERLRTWSNNKMTTCRVQRGYHVRQHGWSASLGGDGGHELVVRPGR